MLAPAISPASLWHISWAGGTCVMPTNPFLSVALIPLWVPYRELEEETDTRPTGGGGGGGEAGKEKHQISLNPFSLLPQIPCPPNSRFPQLWVVVPLLFLLWIPQAPVTSTLPWGFFFFMVYFGPVLLSFPLVLTPSIHPCSISRCCQVSYLHHSSLKGTEW